MMKGAKKVEKLPPLDGGWGWACVTSCCCCLMLFGSIGKAIGIFYVAFLEQFGESASATSWLAAITIFVFSSLAPVASALCTKFYCRTITCIGGLLMSLGLLTTAYSPSLLVAFFTFGGVLGVGMSFSYTGSFLIVSEYFYQKKGLANGLGTAGTGLGALVFPPVIQHLLDHYGFRGMFMIMSAIVLNICAFGLLYRPLDTKHYRTRKIQSSIPNIFDRKGTSSLTHAESEAANDTNLPLNTDAGNDDEVVKDAETVAQQGNRADKEEDETQTAMLRKKISSSCEEVCDSPAHSSRKKRTLFNFSLLKDPAFNLFLLMAFCATGVMIINITFISALAEDNGIALTKSAFLFSALGVGEVVTRPVGGLIFDLACLRERRLYVYSIVIMIIGLTNILAAALVHSFIWLVLVSTLRGVAGGTFFAQRTTVLSDLISQGEVASGFGFMMFASSIGGLVGQVGGGLCKDHFGNYNSTYYVSGIICIIFAIVFASFAAWKQFYRKKHFGQNKNVVSITQVKV